MLTAAPEPRSPDIPAPAPARGRGAFLPDAQADAVERRRLEHEMRQAFERGVYALHYQPRLTIAGDRITGAEALLRWPHRKRGALSPSVFMPVAERTPLIHAIGAWVLQAACEEARRWPAEMSVAVNVSARQLADGTVLSHLGDALDSSRLAPERLTLEFSESALMSITPEALLILAAIRDQGIGIALDDFGAGFSSLTMLKTLPITALKLDRSVVRSIAESEEDAAIVQALIEMGHALGAVVVAEGIETEAQHRLLAEAGCDEGQGYLFHPPLPADRARPLLMGKPAAHKGTRNRGRADPPS